ncbi:MAG TPA: hemerythrin domain-containing protein [Casimicrobiaceae bacterium]|nr:hemerythrin domain-containing protein [Casimicrobiaceae bacterium]
MHTVATKLSPRITTMIRMDHTHVLATFHKYRLDTSPSKKQALVETCCAALEIHAQLEEEIFYPALRSAQPQAVDKSFPEHNEMRRLISALRSMEPGSHQYDETFLELMRGVIHHVADEETILIPAAERVLYDQLEDLGWKMTQRRMELIGPRAGEIAMNTFRAYPALIVTTFAVLALGSVLAYREATSRSGHRWPDARDVKRTLRPARRWLDRSSQRLLSYVR